MQLQFYSPGDVL